MVRVLVVFALLLSTALIALAQSPGTKAIPPIHFKPGMRTAVVEGTVGPPVTVGPDMTNDGFEQYTLRVPAAQNVTMEISSDNHHALFSLTKPSPAMVKYETVERAGGVQRWSGRLAKPGNYLIMVFTRERAVSRFTLRVTLR